MAKKPEETKKATVIEALPNAMFRIQTEDDEELLGYLAGKMKRYHIRVLIGDEIQYVENPYGGKVRITRRL
ncbi:MAG: translation initiation factor IF-1 [Candidatus Paceibacterota bacterium]